MRVCINKVDARIQALHVMIHTYIHSSNACYRISKRIVNSTKYQILLSTLANKSSWPHDPQEDESSNSARNFASIAWYSLSAFSSSSAVMGADAALLLLAGNSR